MLQLIRVAGQKDAYFLTAPAWGVGGLHDKLHTDTRKDIELFYSVARGVGDPIRHAQRALDQALLATVGAKKAVDAAAEGLDKYSATFEQALAKHDKKRAADLQARDEAAKRMKAAEQTQAHVDRTCLSMALQ